VKSSSGMHSNGLLSVLILLPLLAEVASYFDIRNFIIAIFLIALWG